MKKVPAKYDPSKIESKWQKKWVKDKTYSSKEDAKKSKYYVLDMFPYPSGEGLHVGHPKGYIATDIVSRFQRMHGKSVLHPMGFDAFGLPAENYALKTKTNPIDSVATNVARFKKQLEIIGLDYDWAREINTTDPAYYKWTQWIFLELFKKGLAYESFEPINWCPVDKTGLANEDVENGRCERCGALVEKKPMRQWVLKITDYAERLLADLDAKNPSGVPLIVRTTGDDAIRKDLPFIERDPVVCVIKHWSEDKYLCINWKANHWQGFVIGGIEEGESPADAAIREIKEETGYQNIKFVREIGKVDSQFYQAVKKVNRFAHFTGVYVELVNDNKIEISEDEKKLHDLVWVSKNEMEAFITHEDMRYIWDLFIGAKKQEIKPLLDWPNSIKEAQKNWIGKSEGAEIDFKIKSSNKEIKVFTTRPDTLFGVTYVVLAPEHAFVNELLSSISNKAEVEAYVERSKNETEIERTDARKEKTGVELKGIKAINPANNEEVPVWIADYVLADYGTGAVMAVPAHDDRDWDFAKKFGLEIKDVIVPTFGEPNPKAEKTEGSAVIMFDQKTGLYGCLRWSDPERFTIVAGGREGNEPFEDTAKRELAEEAGITKVIAWHKLGNELFCHYWNHSKKVFKSAHSIQFLAIVDSGDVGENRREAHEKFELEWKSAEEILTLFEKTIPKSRHFFEILARAVYKLHELGLDKKTDLNKFSFIKPVPFTEDGILINSDTFSGKLSDSVKKDITLSVGGKWVTKYKLRDWVFSRQRYWGEPIPLIHCEKCGVVPVPEGELPVKLPKVKSYEPTGTGESPLAAIDKWVNVKCPKCEIDKDKPKYFIFDFDGVLGDTWDASLEAYVQGGFKKTKEEAAQDMFDYFSKKPSHTRNHSLTPAELKENWDWTMRFGAELSKLGFGLFKEFIREVKKYKNVKFAVVSSGSSQYVLPAVKKTGLKVSHVLTYEDHHSKEEKIEHISKDWGVDIKDIYYFTDTKADVYELENFLDKKKIIGCSWGYHGLEKLKEVLPEKQILKNFTDIHRYFNVDCIAKRETNTMPQWAGSSWYYLRYMDPKNKKALVDPKKEKYWAPVDLYVGGAEHATRHLIYARFWHKFLYDIGVVSTTEPFIKLQNVGLIMGEDGRKMSKRFGNVVNPDDIVKNYGADSLRLYEMFMGPFDQSIAWSTSSIVGVRRFIEKVWRLREKNEVINTWSNKGEQVPNNFDKVLHKAIKKVTEDINSLSFNTTISTLMIAVNELENVAIKENNSANLSRSQFEILLKLLAPFAPHVAEELWHSLGNKESIHISSWPIFDEKLIIDNEVNIIVQVNGKVRASFKAQTDSTEAQLEATAKEIPEVKKWLEGKSVKKVIVVKRKLVSIVVA